MPFVKIINVSFSKLSLYYYGCSREVVYKSHSPKIKGTRKEIGNYPVNLTDLHR